VLRVHAVTGDSLACGSADGNGGRGVVGESLAAAEADGEVIIPHRPDALTDADAMAGYTGFTLDLIQTGTDVIVGSQSYTTGLQWRLQGGSLCLLGVSYTGGTTLLTVTDDQGNTWTPGGAGGAGAVAMQVFRTVPGSTALTQITLHWTTVGTLHFTWGLWTAIGLGSNAPLSIGTGTGSGASLTVNTPSEPEGCVQFLFIGWPFSELDNVIPDNASDVETWQDTAGGADQGLWMGVKGYFDLPAGVISQTVAWTGSVVYAYASFTFQGHRQ
jgi:hypothetical protein